MKKLKPTPIFIGKYRLVLEEVNVDELPRTANKLKKMLNEKSDLEFDEAVEYIRGSLASNLIQIPLTDDLPDNVIRFPGS